MKFLHLSDTHFRTNYSTDTFTDAIFNASFNPTLNFVQLMKQIDLRDIDFIILTGDLVHEGDVEDYQLLFTLLKSFAQDIPIYYCLGNHDIKPNFYRFLGQDKDSTATFDQVHDFNGLRIITLDTARAGDHEGSVNSQQMAWLKETLSTPSPKGSILIQHHPYYWHDDEIKTTVPEGYTSLLETSDIHGIFIGHVHTSSFTHYAEIPQVMSEAMSFGVDEYAGYSRFTQRIGYNICELTTEGLAVYNKPVHSHEDIGHIVKDWEFIR